MSARAARDLVPSEIALPCEQTDATITLAVEVGDDGVVRALGLRETQAALARGSVHLVTQYCKMWTRWLARAETRTVQAS